MPSVALALEDFVPVVWAEQLLNSLNQGVFMLAARRLERATRPDAPPVPAEAPGVAQD